MAARRRRLLAELCSHHRAGGSSLGEGVAGRRGAVRPIPHPMSADKKWRLVCYDVRDPKRYRRLHKVMKGAGRPVQYSIFRCRLDDREVEQLRWRLAKILDPVDRLLVVDLCPSCASRVISRNHVEGSTEVPCPFT